MPKKVRRTNVRRVSLEKARKEALKKLIQETRKFKMLENTLRNLDYRFIYHLDPKTEEDEIADLAATHLEKLLREVGPREYVRGLLSRYKDEYPYATAVMNELLKNIKTEKEAIKIIKNTLNEEVEGRKIVDLLKDKSVPLTLRADVLIKIYEKLGSTGKYVSFHEMNKALKELGVDLTTRTLDEDDPSNPNFWQRKEEFKRNPSLQELESLELLDTKNETHIKDEIVKLMGFVRLYEAGGLEEEELDDLINEFVDYAMNLAEGDRQKVLRYVDKFDEEGLLYQKITSLLRANEIPSNEDVEREVKNLLEEIKAHPQKLAKDKRVVERLINRAYLKGLHPVEVKRVLRNLVKDKKLKEKILEKIDKVYYGEPDYSEPLKGYL